MTVFYFCGFIMSCTSDSLIYIQTDNKFRNRHVNFVLDFSPNFEVCEKFQKSIFQIPRTAFKKMSYDPRLTFFTWIMPKYACLLLFREIGRILLSIFE